MNSGILEEARRVIRDEITSLEKLLENIGPEIEDAVKLVCSSSKVVVSGVGKSGMIARKIAATLSSIGIPAVFMHPVDALHGDLGIVSQNDCALLLSKSGSTDDIVRLVPYLKSRKASVISITGNIKSFLALNSDYTLDASIEKEACPYNLAPTTSTTTALVLGDALAISCMKFSGFSEKDFARLHPLGQLGRNLTLQVKDIMHANSTLPFILFTKTFKDALVEISDKRLGCVCIGDENKHLQGIITDGDVRRILQRNEDIMEIPVWELMTKDPISISADSYLTEALALMENRDSQISVLPVTENGNICIGVIRVHDIIRSGL